MSLPEIELRRARPEDHTFLTKIAYAAKRHWGYPDEWMRLWQAELTITADFISDAEVWIAFITDEPAGFFGLVVSNGRGRLEHLWVDPTHMKRGVGTLLFRQAAMLGRLKGLSVLEIESDPNAEAFYERMGATRIGERRYTLLGETRLLPVLELRL